MQEKENDKVPEMSAEEAKIIIEEYELFDELFKELEESEEDNSEE